MTDPLRRSISSGDASSQGISQNKVEFPDQAAANCSKQQPDLALEIQALQILDSSDDCIKVLDLEGRILLINRGGQALLGIQDITPFLHTSWVNFWQESERPAVVEAIARAAAGEVCSVQGYCPTLTGEPKWWDIKITPLLDAKGKVERLLCVSRDVSERRQIEDSRKQAEEKVRESEERYQAIINQAVTGVACTDLDGNLTLVNQKYCDIIGYSADEVSQLRMQEITHPEDLPRNIELFQRMRAEGTPFEIEKRYIRKDGSIVWVNNSVSVIRDRNGHPQSAVAIVLDITERKRVELSAELLAMITQNLAEATCVEDIIQTVGEQLHRYLHISNCAFIEINESAEVATIDHGWHCEEVPSLVGTYRLPEFVTGEFFQTAKRGQTIVVQDVTTDSRIVDPEQFLALKIGSFVNVPLIREDQWKFTLNIYHQTPYDWRTDEVDLMRELANRIWTKLERIRVEMALRQSQEMFSALVAEAPLGVCTIDAKFRFQQANQAAIATFNLGPLTGRDLTEALRIIWQEPFATEVIDCFRHTLATGEPYYSLPISEPRADITEVQSYDWRIHRITLPDGSYGVVCYFYDLSEIKRAEDIIRRTGDRDAFLVTLNDALRPLTDAIAIQATANRVLGEYLGVSRVAYFEVRGADYFVERDYVNGVKSLQGGYPIESFGAELLAISRSGQTAIATDVARDPHLSSAQRSAYAGIQIGAYISVPLLKQGELVAGLAIHSSTRRDWTPDEIALAADVAERTWAAVERAHAEAALRASEAKYRSLFESIDEGFCLIEVLLDDTGKAFDYYFLEANPAFEKHTGLTNVIGKTVRELLPQHEAYWFEIYGRIALTGIPERFENAAQGLGRFYDVYAFRMGEPQERQVAVLFNDISERKQTEAAIAADLRDTQRLRELSARLSTEDNPQVLYDAIVSTAIGLTGADAGSIQALDKSTQELVLIATQGIDRSVTEPLQRVKPDALPSCGVVLATGKRAFVDFDVSEREDLDGWLRLHRNAGLISAQSTPLISRSGKRIGIVSTYWHQHHRPSDRELRFLDLLTRQAADLIEQRQTTAEREQLLAREQAAREEADRANRIKDEFLAVLSHELRSPLNPILGWTRLLQNSNLDAARQKEALATIERNAKLQTQLIEDLLDISRIMRGKLSLTVAPVSLTYVISAALETVRLAAEAKTIEIILNLAPDVAPVTGDAARLQQVVWNLLANAIKFTPEGGQVMVELKQLTRLAQIRVVDTGKGISPQFLPHVFEYFLQEDGSTTRKFGGLGLGLAIVRQIVQLHGGSVWAESQGEGQGATFMVQLPTMQQIALVSESSQPPSDAGLPLAGIEILLVDDEPDAREFQAFLLEQNGATVIAVASGLEALQALEQSSPDVLVSDIGMPEMDGYSLLQQIRSYSPEQGGRIPAVALTAYATEIDQQRALQAGFQTHLTKPVELKELVQAIIHLYAAGQTAADGR